MAEVELRPLAVDIDEIEDIGLTVHGLVNYPGAVDYFDTRHLWGVIARHYWNKDDGYVAPEQSVESLRNTVTGKKAAEIGAFTVRLDGEIIGMASIQPNLTLRKQNIPLIPGYARKFSLFSKPVDVQGANIAAWVGGNFSQFNLQSAYQQLLQLQNGEAWTIEPQRSYDAVHEAIYDAGMKVEDTGFFDDEESRRKTPPSSHLYVPK